jgi:hypothetical protein
MYPYGEVPVFTSELPFFGIMHIVSSKTPGIIKLRPNKNLNLARRKVYLIDIKLF